MNNQVPFFNPFYNIPQPNINECQTIENKLTNIEKKIDILETKIDNLAKIKENKDEDTKDMYML